MKLRKIKFLLPAAPIFSVLSASGILASLSPLRATEYTWTGTGTALTSTANWDPTGVPSESGDSIVYNGTNSNDKTLRTSSSTTLGGATGLSVISVAAGQTGTLTMAPGASAPASNIFRFDVGATVSIASGAGAFTLGDESRTLILALGGGSDPYSGTAVFSNNSSNTATLTSFTRINRGGTGGGSRGLEFGGTGDWSVGSAIQGVDHLNKTGTGRMTFSGNTETTSLAEGVSIDGGNFVLIGSLDNPDSAVTIGTSGTLSGGGTVAGNVINNGTLSPGMSPGALNIGGDLTLGSEGNFNWQVYDASGTAGIGYDTLVLGGALDLASLNASTPFNINLWSLSGIDPDVEGDALNFDSSQNYIWTLISTESSISGFDEDLFQINIASQNGTSGFSNAINGGLFSVALGDGGTDLELHFSAVPEPENYAILGSVFIIALVLLRRCKSSLS